MRGQWSYDNGMHDHEYTPNDLSRHMPDEKFMPVTPMFGEMVLAHERGIKTRAVFRAAPKSMRRLQQYIFVESMMTPRRVCRIWAPNIPASCDSPNISRRFALGD
ncbi:unnamed protein product [Sphacelaria rigidula]